MSNNHLTNTPFSTPVTPGFELQTLLQSIVSFPISSIGSDAFLESYCIHLERLSITACWTACASVGQSSDSVDIDLKTKDSLKVFTEKNDGEYVVEAFWEQTDKIESMVETLLAVEYWRENVLFSRSNNSDDEYDELNEVDGGENELADRLANNGNGLRTAFILHAETTIVSLLSLIFYRGIPPTLLEGSNSGDEVLLALVDYCARQLVRCCCCCVIAFNSERRWVSTGLTPCSSQNLPLHRSFLEHHNNLTRQSTNKRIRGQPPILPTIYPIEAVSMKYKIPSTTPHIKRLLHP
jgi:hypothetical protein